MAVAEIDEKHKRDYDFLSIYGETMLIYASNMLKTLESYQKCSYGSIEVDNRPATELENHYREYLNLKGRYESLQRRQRNLNLGPLNSKELEQLERQLDGFLKQVRGIKTQYMLDQQKVHGKVVMTDDQQNVPYGHHQVSTI